MLSPSGDSSPARFDLNLAGAGSELPCEEFDWFWFAGGRFYADILASVVSP